MRMLGRICIMSSGVKWLNKVSILLHLPVQKWFLVLRGDFFFFSELHQNDFGKQGTAYSWVTQTRCKCVFIGSLNIGGHYDQKNEPTIFLPSGVHTKNLKLTLNLDPAYMEKSWHGAPSPRANFTARLHGKNVSRVMMSCPSQRTEISACACSAWRHLARLGELTRLKPFTWEKVGSPPGSPCLANRVTLPPGSPCPPSQVCSFSCKRSTMHIYNL